MVVRDVDQGKADDFVLPLILSYPIPETQDLAWQELLVPMEYALQVGVQGASGFVGLSSKFGLDDCQ